MVLCSVPAGFQGLDDTAMGKTFSRGSDIAEGEIYTNIIELQVIYTRMKKGGEEYQLGVCVSGVDGTSLGRMAIQKLSKKAMSRKVKKLMEQSMIISGGKTWQTEERAKIKALR